MSPLAKCGPGSETQPSTSPKPQPTEPRRRQASARRIRPIPPLPHPKPKASPRRGDWLRDGDVARPAARSLWAASARSDRDDAEADGLAQRGRAGREVATCQQRHQRPPAPARSVAFHWATVPVCLLRCKPPHPPRVAVPPSTHGLRRLAGSRRGAFDAHGDFTPSRFCAVHVSTDTSLSVTRSQSQRGGLATAGGEGFARVVSTPLTILGRGDRGGLC